MFGAAAMSLSSFCVVSNALRLNWLNIHDSRRDRPAGKRKKQPDAISQLVPAGEMDRLLRIEGMMCTHCEARVTQALEALPQVASVQVSWQAGAALVTLQENVDNDVLKAAVEAEEYTVTSIE